MTTNVPPAVDLGRVLRRGTLLEFLEHTARFYASRLTILDRELTPIAGLNRQGVGGVRGPFSLFGDGGGWEIAAHRVHGITVYETTLGFVSADPVTPGDESAAAALSKYVANLLSELAAREYEIDDLSREILESYEEVNLFYDISSALGSAVDAESVCDTILKKVCEIIEVRRASILLVDDPGENLYIAAAIGMKEDEWRGVRIPVGDGISGKVLASRTAQLVDDVRHLPRGLRKGYEGYATRSFMSVPLCVGAGKSSEASWAARAAGPAIGVINLADKGGDGAFTSGDLKLLVALASQAALLMQNIRLIGLEREFHIARKIQDGLLPESAPEFEGVDIAGRCEPARNVGGDYYDLLVRDGEDGADLVAAVADVSGHNLASALMMAVARSALRAEVHQTEDPGEVLGRLNRFLYDDLSKAELFLSLLLAVFQPGRSVLRYASAGHHPALHYRRREGRCKPLSGDGLLTGVLADARYRRMDVTLEEGDVVVLYTDGLVEAAGAGGELFGAERLAALVESTAGQGAKEILTAVFDRVAAFSGDRPARDDRTAVVLKIDGPTRR